MKKTLYLDGRCGRGEPLWILTAGSRIESMGHEFPPDADKSVSLEGRPLLPGMINAHTHLYSALAGFLAWPSPRPEDFREILKQVWWKLDRALDEESIRASARMGLFEALRHGTTTIVDHHSSPSHVEGSLDILAEEAERMGLKLVLAFESSDRDGEDVFHASVQENLRAIETYSGHESLRAIFGLHASFTLSDESLRSCAEASDAPFHIHCAESEWDLVDARERGFDSVIDRLDKLGILRPGTLLAHGIHLAEGDAERIREADCRLIHCPQSNEFNGLGRADVSSLSDDGVLLGLGSDGFGSGMLKEASLASAEGARLLGEGNARIASDLFGRNIGRLQAGADADFITLDEEGGVAQCVSSGKLVFDASESNSDALQKLGDWARGEASRLGERIGLEG